MQILIVHTIAGRLDRLEAVLERTSRDIGAIFVLGNLLARRDAPAAELASPPEPGQSRDYAAVLDLLGQAGVPVFLIPGATDAPLAALAEALRRYHGPAQLHLVHRTVARLHGGDIVVGFGGRLVADQADPASADFATWEVQVAFEHLAAYNRIFQTAERRIFLFATPPQGGQLDREGGVHVGEAALNAAMRGYQPHLVCCGGPASARGIERIDGTLVVNPGALADGSYALLDLERLEARLEWLPLQLCIEEPPLHSLVVALDGSPESWRALEIAASLAQSARARLTLVYAFEPIGRSLGAPYFEHAAADRCAQGERLLAAASAYIGGLSPSCEVVEGPPAEAIVRVAETQRADLIVMGARGLGSVRTLMGSISSRVLRLAPCPVLIARQPPRNQMLADQGATALAG